MLNLCENVNRLNFTLNLNFIELEIFPSTKKNWIFIDYEELMLEIT